jgi:hypothetical protein
MGRRKLFPVAKQRLEAGRDLAQGVLGADQLGGQPIGFKRAVQPGGDRLVLVAVADERR